jgi:hypothetical protein
MQWLLMALLSLKAIPERLNHLKRGIRYAARAGESDFGIGRPAFLITGYPFIALIQTVIRVHEKVKLGIVIRVSWSEWSSLFHGKIPKPIWLG